MASTEVIPSPSLADVQDEPDRRGVAIASVGICALSHPARVRRQGGGHYEVPARFRLGTDLAPERRGTHLSRLVEAIGEVAGDLSPARVPELLELLRARLSS